MILTFFIVDTKPSVCLINLSAFFLFRQWATLYALQAFKMDKKISDKVRMYP